MVDVDKCKLTKYPSNVLAKSAEPVDKIDDSIRALADKMKDLMVETKGVGFAAPQAGVGLRMFVISTDGTKENAKVYINPQIDPSGPLEVSEEGCLSLPGVAAKIRRYRYCKVTATGLDGKEFTEEGAGLLAKALQHEYDHLEGTMIKDRMSQVSRIAFRKHLKRLEEEHKNKE
jgi:peptide deformylase